MTTMFEETPFFKKACVSVYLADEITWKTSHDWAKSRNYHPNEQIHVQKKGMKYVKC